MRIDLSSSVRRSSHPIGLSARQRSFRAGRPLFASFGYASAGSEGSRRTDDGVRDRRWSERRGIGHSVIRFCFVAVESAGLCWAAAADYRANFGPALAPQQRFRLFHLAAAQDAGAAALYLSVTAFGPTPATSPASVKWAVTARRQFPLSRIEVLRYPDANDKKGKFQAVARAQIDSASTIAGEWALGYTPAVCRRRCRQICTSGACMEDPV